MVLLLSLSVPATASAGTTNGYENLHNQLRGSGTLISEVQDANRDDQDQMLCLAQNIYHEVKGLPDRDQWAVAFVTWNRTQRTVFKAKTICSAVWAPGQFSWTRWPTRAQLPRERAVWTECQRKAVLIVRGEKMKDPTNGATHFNTSMKNWGRGLVDRFRIGPMWYARLPGIK